MAQLWHSRGTVGAQLGLSWGSVGAQLGSESYLGLTWGTIEAQHHLKHSFGKIKTHLGRA